MEEKKYTKWATLLKSIMTKTGLIIKNIILIAGLVMMVILFIHNRTEKLNDFDFKINDLQLIITEAADPELCKMVHNDDIQYIKSDKIPLDKKDPTYMGITRYHANIDMYNNNSPIEFIEFREYSGVNCNISYHTIGDIDIGNNCYSGLRFFEYNNQIYAAVTSWISSSELYSVLKWNGNDTPPKTICKFAKKEQSL